MHPFAQPGPIQPDKYDVGAVERAIEEDKIAGYVPTRKTQLQVDKAAKQQMEEDEEKLRSIKAVRADSINMKITRWLWRQRVPLGGLSLLAGKGDVSKSTVFAQFAAWITLGDMKGEYYGQPKDVGYIVNEDSIEETVVPRMVAHGADLTRVHFLSVESPLGEAAIMLPRDAKLLREFIKDNGLACVFIDPLSANVSGKKNDQGEMRSTFQVVNNLAISTKSSIFGLAHSRKAGGDDIVETVLGSSEQTNVARAVLGLVPDPEEDGARILSAGKLNVGQKDKLTSMRFRVRSVDVQCSDGVTSMPRIEWLQEINETASDILADKLNGHGNIDECMGWLDDFMLKQGGVAYAQDIKEAAKPRRYSESMLNRARRNLRITSQRETGVSRPRSIWTHPEADPGSLSQ